MTTSFHPVTAALLLHMHWYESGNLPIPNTHTHTDTCTHTPMGLLMCAVHGADCEAYNNNPVGAALMSPGFFNPTTKPIKHWHMNENISHENELRCCFPPLPASFMLPSLSCQFSSSTFNISLVNFQKHLAHPFNHHTSLQSILTLYALKSSTNALDSLFQQTWQTNMGLLYDRKRVNNYYKCVKEDML